MRKTRSISLVKLAAVAMPLLVYAGHASSASPPEHAEAGAGLADGIVGTWELVSYKVEDKETGKLVDAMGDTPRGRVIFTKDGWVAFNLEGSDRRTAATDAERASLLKTLVAYIGRYRIEGDQWVTKVQTAWIPEWVGTEQRRTVRIDGDFADVTTPWRVMPNWNDGRMSRSLIRFKHAS